MKTINTLAITILFCFTISFQTFAQGYSSPSREQIEIFLLELENCKAFLTDSENLIKTMEADPESYTLAVYNAAKSQVETSKICVNARRAELDELRKDYPGWFNNPNATLPLSKGHSITPRKLKLSIEDIQEKINTIIKRFEALNVTEN